MKEIAFIILAGILFSGMYYSLIWKIRNVKNKCREEILYLELRLAKKNGKNISDILDIINDYNSMHLNSNNTCLRMITSLQKMIERLQFSASRALTPDKLTLFKCLIGKSVIIFGDMKEQNIKDLKSFLVNDFMFFKVTDISVMDDIENIEENRADILIFLKNDKWNIIAVNEKKEGCIGYGSMGIIAEVVKIIVANIKQDSINKNLNFN